MYWYLRSSALVKFALAIAVVSHMKYPAKGDDDPYNNDNCPHTEHKHLSTSTAAQHYQVPSISRTTRHNTQYYDPLTAIQMSNPTYAPMPPQTPLLFLPHLPDELLLHILSYLDIPDLLSFSRISHQMRLLSLDPLLHLHRLHRASFALERYIPIRPSLAELMAHRIYITRTTLAARNLGRSLIKIKLNRQLLKRPSAEELVELGVLPKECYGKGRDGRWLAPSLVETKRRVERERVKDVLRGWVEEWRRRGSEIMDRGEEGKPDVRRMARRFAVGREGRDVPSWGRRVDIKEAPTRAKVLGLRRFWEKVGREGLGA